ncbi:hypothetical protein COCCU_05110 [Corynebacterium occultum]|uniref:DUF2218 domain-containing protein n=1 Tax=Corynebacterium occultum TaxID=2675219 RepID=A0A6B8WKL2_9CORY|nr:DUF2218 domain-containing protein [Corynebacterium occultum]QGU06968.1 hypothetical protein COCCU_05110 [Corynebacterium occultum]
MTSASTARVATQRPTRYGRQLASHFSRNLKTDWDEAEGRGHLSFEGELPGEVSMIAGDAVLLLYLEAAPEHVEQLELVIARHLVHFGARDELKVSWRREGGVAGLVYTSADLPED